MAASLIEALPKGDLREEEEIIARHCAAMAYAGAWKMLWFMVIPDVSSKPAGADTVGKHDHCGLT